jgi:hypothetical protein
MSNSISSASYTSKSPSSSSTSTSTSSPLLHFPTPHSTYTINLETASTISPTELEQCFELITLTSSSAYQASGLGWIPDKKRQEMRLPDMRYLIVRNSAAGHAGHAEKGEGEGEGEEKEKVQVEGFCSFMLTYEDGREVVYCYELHLAPRLRRLGLGKKLMGLVEGVGRKVGVEKAMLTVFVENRGGRRFYEGLGYKVDEYSPRPRRLRGGVVKEPTYLILSKRL